MRRKIAISSFFCAHLLLAVTTFAEAKPALPATTTKATDNYGGDESYGGDNAYGGGEAGGYGGEEKETTTKAPMQVRKERLAIGGTVETLYCVRLRPFITSRPFVH